MEESEKRRERLKAMRMEANLPGVNIDLESSEVAPRGLSNPLIESETASTTQYTSPRFDYYTDPMSAFSGSRRNNTAPQVSHGQYNTPRSMYPGPTPSPPYQNPPINSPGPRTFQVPPPHYNQSPPLGRPPGNPPSHWGGPPGNPPSHWGGPPGNPPSHRGGPPGNRPSHWGGPRGGPHGAFNYNSPPNLSRDGNFTNPGFVQGNSSYVNYGRGRGGQRYNNNSYNDSGRGRGRSFGNSMIPGRGPTGRRESGPRESVSAEFRPDLYYKKEMLEDPWKGMTPVVWKGAKAPDSEKNWLPKSISTKKAKVSSEGSSQGSISQPSLAEYLAALNEPVDDKQDT
ncbi:hypothetical protein BUALT_Bualt08G0065900 [Buddleja alternifolia]|uniref:Uncharacterized protein n=1 Tax=Buddleja alternifolia TaxID=168488 RepID=A0AAV6X5V8_9LAMI|nr:hypothetical protein BUALT_Bualt08G0065900 [Buddleja alternifolia]